MRISSTNAAAVRALLLGVLLASAFAVDSACAFDLSGFRARLDATTAEVKAKSIGDPKATLARLDEMIELGKVGAQEYATRQPKFARLMSAAIADAEAMRALTDTQIEDKWGENGSAGDAVGVPLKSLGQFDETRAYLELMVSPAHTYIFLKKWQSGHKSQMLDKASDELAELAEHLKQVQ
jgi:predicted outer membrane lipoprotein